ncbi:hypothetical protein [Cellulomonas fimi]|uniref:hypothetical protein n=1 Tax=Cellulomonas fimi TaxID=1708 RepID=UPI002358E6AD|nr:hypothetical protein [Cellulomonas fimi]
MPRLVRPLNPWRLIGAPLPERFEVARDATSTAEELTVVAPPAQDAKTDPSLTGVCCTDG